MPKLNTIDRLAALADDKVQKQLRELASGIHNVSAQQAKLLQLENYVGEYATNNVTPNRQLNAQRLKQEVGFMGQLSQVVKQQASVLTAAEQTLAHQQSQYRLAQTEAKKYHTLRDKALMKVQRSRGRAEQKQTDAIATRRQPRP